MNREEMKREFPAMPEDIRAMIEKEVKKQVNVPARKIRPVRKIALIAAAAVLLMTSALAVGTAVLRFRVEPVGEYGLTVGIEAGEQGESEKSRLPLSAVEATWLPEGMELAPYETLKWHYTDGTEGAISISPMVLDKDVGEFEIAMGGVIDQERLDFNGNDAIYIQQQGDHYAQSMYILFEEDGYALDIMADKMDKETLIRFAEGLRLDLQDEPGEDAMIVGWTWSERMEPYSADYEENSQDEPDRCYELSREEMEGILHTVNETFPVYFFGGIDMPDLDSMTVKVVSVETVKNFDGLDERWIPESWTEYLDENGVLMDDTIEYYVYGDGIHTLDEMVHSETVGQVVLMVDVEYTNITEHTLKEICFDANLMRLVETEESYTFYDHAASMGYDYYDETMAGGKYYEHSDIGNGGNYIPELAAGESKTLRFAWVVNEYELDTLFLNLNNVNSGIRSFADYDRQVGYVDIRP